ncbi:hypothetical protein LINGRAHAP2_LOCUS21451 [Linum grandiflorum]
MRGIMEGLQIPLSLGIRKFTIQPDSKATIAILSNHTEFDH